jgi:glycosyltransferase involved in cell wall biosynthesis
LGKHSNSKRILFDKLIGNLAWKQANKIICMSPIEKNILITKRIMENKICIIPPPIDEFFYSTSIDQDLINIKKVRKRILFVGRLDITKGLVHLLTAFNMLSEDLLDTDLIIVGDDSL